MKIVKIENIENFFDLVHGMEVNTYYELPENCRYKWIKIEKESEYYSKETLLPAVYHCKSCGFISTRRKEYTYIKSVMFCVGCKEDYEAGVENVIRWVTSALNVEAFMKARESKLVSREPAQMLNR